MDLSTEKDLRKPSRPPLHEMSLFYLEGVSNMPKTFTSGHSREKVSVPFSSFPLVPNLNLLL